MLEKLAEFKWGVVALFLGAAWLVGAEVVPHDDPTVRAGAIAAAAVVAVGGPAVVLWLSKRAKGPKP